MEIDFLTKSAHIAEQSIKYAISKLELGMTELDIATLYKSQVVKLGADLLFNVVSAGLRSAFVDTGVTGQIIDKNSILRFDVGCNYHGYKSDISRTFSIGKATARAKNYYRAIKIGEETAIASIKPGVKASSIFTIAQQEVRKGIPQFSRHHCGHGIGLEVYEPPSIAYNSDMLLEEGMVLCIETPYYELGSYGLQVEDMVVVTSNGARYLTKSPDVLEEI